MAYKIKEIKPFSGIDLLYVCTKKDENLINQCQTIITQMESVHTNLSIPIQKHSNIHQYDSIINLQGDMPLIKPQDIQQVNFPLQQGYDIGTLVTSFKDDNEAKDNNITKVRINWIKRELIGRAFDFNKDINSFKEKDYYHHIGIYSFRYAILKKFISLPPSNNENIRHLEQMRALDANISIGVGYVKNVPISIDTNEDLLKVEKLI